MSDNVMKIGNCKECTHYDKILAFPTWGTCVVGLMDDVDALVEFDEGVVTRFEVSEEFGCVHFEARDAEV